MPAQPPVPRFFLELGAIVRWLASLQPPDQRSAVRGYFHDGPHRPMQQPLETNDHGN